MKHIQGNLATTAIPVLVLAAVAAAGWYYYYSEVEINQFQTADSRTQEELLNNKLENQQTRIDKLSQDASGLQAKLVGEEKLRRELASTLEKTTAEKLAMESGLQQQLAELKSTTAGLETEIETQQTKVNKLQKNETALKHRLASEKDSREVLDARLASEKESREELAVRLASEKESREELAARLEHTMAEKMAMESELKGEVQRVTLTTAELEAELKKRWAMQESLSDEINTISGEKSELRRQLEQEQESNKQIANLKDRLEQELNESRVEISQLRNQMTVIKLTSEVLFSSGSAKIKPSGEKVLSIIAESLNAYPLRAISVEGHTDNIPIRNAYFKSNWELSAARGLAAVDYFQKNADVDPKRLKVVGFGQYHPVSSNESAEGRQLNRRIEIRILPPQ